LLSPYCTVHVCCPDTSTFLISRVEYSQYSRTTKCCIIVLFTLPHSPVRGCRVSALPPVLTTKYIHLHPVWHCPEKRTSFLSRASTNHIYPKLQIIPVFPVESPSSSSPVQSSPVQSPLFALYVYLQPAGMCRTLYTDLTVNQATPSPYPRYSMTRLKTAQSNLINCSMNPFAN
jgi:hypothetical protein